MRYKSVSRKINATFNGTILIPSLPNKTGIQIVDIPTSVWVRTDVDDASRSCRAVTMT